MAEITLQEERIPLHSQIWVSAADAACAILQTLAASSALTYYFVNLRGLSLELAGVVWLLFGLWNAVNDPLFGYISDRTKSNLGRRLPYIRYGAPIFALGFVIFWIWVPGSDNNQTLMFIQMLVGLFIYDSLYTAIATSIYIMPYEMAVSNKARSGIYIWKIAFMVFTLAVPMVIEGTVKPQPGDMPGITLFRWVLIGFGIGMAVIVFISTFFYKEKHLQQAEEQPGFIESIKECFKNRSFVVFETISFTIMFVQTVLMQGMWNYFDALGMPREPFYGALALGIVLGTVLWVSYRDRWGVKKSTRIMSLIFAVGCFTMLLFGRLMVPAVLGFFLFGFGFSGGMFLIPLMNGDVVDMDEHKTGLRREGMYAGINSLVTKPAISLGQWSMLTIMGAFGYDRAMALSAQSYDAQTGIIVAWMLVPALLLLTCFFTLHWYPLDGKEWEAIKAKLSEIHAEKERRYLESLGYKYVEK